PLCLLLCSGDPPATPRCLLRADAGRPALHSFPTRRSSDLAYGSAMYAGEATGKIEHKTTAPATEAAKRWQGWGTALKPAFEPIVDRKSTRLNSSHVSISYAVFCLKKKKRSTDCRFRGVDGK